MAENIATVQPEFDLSPDTGPAKITITAAGEKGEGKTTFALSVPTAPDGMIGAITLDLKTALIRDWLGSKNVTVYNGVRYFTDASSDEKQIVQAGGKTYRYLLSLLDKMQIEGNYDWILFDGLEILINICELNMRNSHKLGATEGFANLNLWKERRMFLRSLHHKALNAARRGVIYTTYMEFVAELIEDERTVKGKKHPKWIDVIMYETDVAVHCYDKEDSVGKKRYYVKVMSSKRPTFIKDGITVEVTGPDYAKMFGPNPVALEHPEPKKKIPGSIPATQDITKTSQEKEEGKEGVIPF